MPVKKVSIQCSKRKTTQKKINKTQIKPSYSKTVLFCVCVKLIRQEVLGAGREQRQEVQDAGPKVGDISLGGYGPGSQELR